MNEARKQHSTPERSADPAPAEPANPATHAADPQERDPSSATRGNTRSPVWRYIFRLGIGMALYAVSLAIAIALQSSGIGGVLPALLTLPSVAVIAWAGISLYRESDEFAQRKFAESFVLAFAIGVPILLVVGLFEALGGPHLSWMLAFTVMMVSWMIGSMAAQLKYR